MGLYHERYGRVRGLRVILEVSLPRLQERRRGLPDSLPHLYASFRCSSALPRDVDRPDAQIQPTLRLQSHPPRPESTRPGHHDRVLPLRHFLQHFAGLLLQIYVHLFRVPASLCRRNHHSEWLFPQLGAPHVGVYQRVRRDKSFSIYSLRGFYDTLLFHHKKRSKNYRKSGHYHSHGSLRHSLPFSAQRSLPQRSSRRDRLPFQTEMAHALELHYLDRRGNSGILPTLNRDRSNNESISIETSKIGRYSEHCLRSHRSGGLWTAERPYDFHLPLAFLRRVRFSNRRSCTSLSWPGTQF